jgi:hypothetical protein
MTPDGRILAGGKGACVTSTGKTFVPLGGVRGAYANCLITGEEALLDDKGKTTHVDVHCFMYSDLDNKIYMGTDGGIVRFTLDPNNPGKVAHWEPLNANSLTNFLSESVAFSPSSPYNVLAGHQDNGVVHLQNPVWSSAGGNESVTVFYDPFGTGYFIDCSGGCGGLQVSADGGKTFPETRTIPWDVHDEKLYFHPTQKDRMMIPCQQTTPPARCSIWESTDGFRTAGEMHDLNLPNKGDHFYTTDPIGGAARGLGYNEEGIACYVRTSGIKLQGLVPFYRWINPVSGDHFYTRNDPDEHPASAGYIAEGIACYVFNQPVTGAVPLYRFYNPVNGDHLYTRNEPDERPTDRGYTAEGIACYVFPSQIPGTVAFHRWFNQSDGFASGLCYAGTGSNYIYVCSGNRIFCTMDDGRSWKQIWKAQGSLQTICTDVNNPSRIFVTVYGFGGAKVLYNPDIVNTPNDFEDITGDLAPAARKIAVYSKGPGSQPIIYATTAQGIFKTLQPATGSTKWKLFGTGLPDTDIQDIKLNSVNHWVYAATYGRGVWTTIDVDQLK